MCKIWLVLKQTTNVQSCSPSPPLGHPRDPQTLEELYPRRFLAKKLKIKIKKLLKQHRTLEIVVFGVEDVPGGQLELLCWKLWDVLRLYFCFVVVVWNAAKPVSGRGSPMLCYQSRLLTPPGQRCQRVSPHPCPSLPSIPALPSPARSPPGPTLASAAPPGSGSWRVSASSRRTQWNTRGPSSGTS